MGLTSMFAASELSAQGNPVTVLYRNWRNETNVRRIVPWKASGSALWFGSTEWHPEQQWFLSAIDIEKDARRDWALSGFLAWGQDAVDAVLASATDARSAAAIDAAEGEGAALREQGDA